MLVKEMTAPESIMNPGMNHLDFEHGILWYVNDLFYIEGLRFLPINKVHK